MSLSEQLTRAFNALDDASSRNSQRVLASLNDHITNLIRQVGELEAKQSEERDGDRE